MPPQHELIRPFTGLCSLKISTCSLGFARASGGIDSMQHDSVPQWMIIFLRSIGFPGTFAIGQTHCFLFARFPHGDSTGPGFRIAKKAVCTAIILLQIWYGVGATAPLSIRIVAILRKLRRILLTLPIPAQMWASSKCMGDLQAEHNCLEEQNGATSQQG